MEILGNYDSRRGESASFKADRIKHWMSVGAQVSTTVHNLLVSKKIIEGKKRNALPLKKPTPTQQVGEPTENVGFAKEEVKVEEKIAEEGVTETEVATETVLAETVEETVA